MKTRLSLSLSLLVILTKFQVLRTLTTWVVTLSQYEMCAMAGSSVVVSCNFTHSHKPNLKVTKVYWGINAKSGVQLRDLLNLPQYKGRVQNSTDMKRTCTLTLSDVRDSDTAKYYARIETDEEKEKWQGPQLSLKVFNLAVQISGLAIEGRQVTLTCKSYCILRDNSKIVWMKNDGILADRETKSNELILHNIQTEDDGNYSCALEYQSLLPSPAVMLSVMYPPRIPSASVSPSSEIVEGTSVTLTCSSDANPPVHSYTWYKRIGAKISSVSSNHVYNIFNVSRKHREYFYCMATNQYGAHNSTDVYLDVQYSPKITSTSLSPSGEIHEGYRVTLTCSSDANPPVQSYTWYKRSESETLQITTQKNYTISRASSTHTGYYYCHSENRHGSANSIDIHLNVLYPPKNVSAFLNCTGDLKEGASVTLSCSSDANPPVENYTWYRRTGDETTAVDTGETITFTLNSTTAGLYYCEAKNRIGNTSASVKVFLTGSGAQSVAVIAGGAGASLLVLIVVLTAVMIQKRKTAANSTSDSVSRTQGSPDSEYANFSHATSDPAQNLDLGDDDDVQYTSVQFKRSSQKPKTQQQQEEEVEYAAVNFSRHTAAINTSADTDVYSAINKPRKKN